MNPKQLSDRIENIDDRLVQLDRGRRVHCAHGVQLLRGCVCLCQRDCGRGSYRAGDTND